jgi:hypothetical protein
MRATCLLSSSSKDSGILFIYNCDVSQDSSSMLQRLNASRRPGIMHTYFLLVFSSANFSSGCVGLLSSPPLTFSCASLALPSNCSPPDDNVPDTLEGASFCCAPVCVSGSGDWRPCCGADMMQQTGVQLIRGKFLQTSVFATKVF